MTPKDTERALLPSGMIDLLPPEAEQEAKAISILMKKYAAFGYQLIKPPLVEFEDSLFAEGPGAALAEETFRLMDPNSHRMMGVRSDMTPQIARIAAVRLAQEERPLRLCYTGNVLRTRSDQQRPERQFTQVGCELIGTNDPEADIESCVLAVLGLKAIGLNDITIDLSLPQLIGKIFDDLGLPDDEKTSIEAALCQRNRDVVQDAPQVFRDLMECGGAGEKALAALEKIKLPKNAKADVETIKVIYTGVQKALAELAVDDVSVSIDPLERKGFEYHSHFGFALFAKHTRGELGRGGHYEVRFGADENTETAAGFTLYMDSIRRALPVPEQKEMKDVAADTSWAEIEKIQQGGQVVVRKTK